MEGEWDELEGVSVDRLVVLLHIIKQGLLVSDIPVKLQVVVHLCLIGTLELPSCLYYICPIRAFRPFFLLVVAHEFPKTTTGILTYAFLALFLATFLLLGLFLTVFLIFLRFL